MAPRMTSLRWPVPAHLRALPALGFSDCNFAPSGRSCAVSCSQVAQIQCSGALCCPEYHNTCQLAGRGLHTVLMESFPGSHLFRKGTLTLPTCRRIQEDSVAPVSCPAPTFHSGASGVPTERTRIRNLENAQPTQRPRPHRKAPAQVNCSDTPAAQAGDRMVKDTGWGADCWVAVLYPQQGTGTQGTKLNLTEGRLPCL